jgi:hypothetical protein
MDASLALLGKGLIASLPPLEFWLMLLLRLLLLRWLSLVLQLLHCWWSGEDLSYGLSTFVSVC